MNYSLRQKLGAIVYDLPRFLWAMRPSQSRSHTQASWVLMRNRNERLIPNNNDRGVACDWQWTSDLHLAKVFPHLGLRLMKRALRDWPIESRDEPAPPGGEDSPAVSFVIGHRGTERLPHLLATLRSIAAQRGVSFECIVVEQSPAPEVKGDLPSWVRYIHTPLPYASMPYSRAWAFNVGARMAQGERLILHDNDILVPQDYAAQLTTRFDEGYEVINLKRFIFFLNESHSKRMLSERRSLTSTAPETIMQNAEGGGSVAVSRKAYFAIGGFDEAFVGWGGEDVEFWGRAKTLRCWHFGYLPLVHLWHEPQPGKRAINGNGELTARLIEERQAILPLVRIEELRKRDFGRLTVSQSLVRNESGL